VDWGRRAVARAYAASAATYAERFGDEFVTNEFDLGVAGHFLEHLPEGSRVLDGGCGPGQFAAVAAEQGFTPVGIDITLEMLQVARQRLTTPLLACADLCDLPFKDASFGAMVCWFSIHNLPRELLPLLLVEARRILTEGGQLLLGTHEGTSEEKFTDEVGESFSFTYYDSDELASLLSRAGFTAVETTVRAPFSGEHQVQKLFATALANA